VNWRATDQIVAVCRAGGRSAQATNILQQASFKAVANLTGGMLRTQQPQALRKWHKAWRKGRLYRVRR
jgi:hypothetical protein